jgi:hypothetical protein
MQTPSADMRTGRLLDRSVHGNSGCQPQPPTLHKTRVGPLRSEAITGRSRPEARQILLAGPPYARPPHRQMTASTASRTGRYAAGWPGQWAKSLQARRSGAPRLAGSGADVSNHHEQGVLPEVVGLSPGDPYPSGPVRSRHYGRHCDLWPGRRRRAERPLCAARGRRISEASGISTGHHIFRSGLGDRRRRGGTRKHRCSWQPANCLSGEQSAKFEM